MGQAAMAPPAVAVFLAEASISATGGFLAAITGITSADNDSPEDASSTEAHAFMAAIVAMTAVTPAELGAATTEIIAAEVYTSASARRMFMDLTITIPAAAIQPDTTINGAIGSPTRDAM